MALQKMGDQGNFVPVCASVICEAPGVIYVSIDPDVWKIRCRQCQEKTEHKCALKRLKNKFRGDPSKRRVPKVEDPPIEVVGEPIPKEPESDMDLKPAEPIPDDCCACEDRPKDAPMKPNVCLCDIYRPLNFMLEFEVTGEFKPAYVPKARKGKD
ncbi:hypothetical protein RUM43_011094 [Polyplax serrata]|uniref:Uncharacterized protein n=1 Tax=Polyplax serrata TaxID=468196 RepID=A0AAN8P4L2_POLSC